MGHTVLLVDDDERLLLGLLRALHKQPFQMYTAHNGAEAVWALKTHDVDVIVSDALPGTLRSVSPGRPVPIKLGLWTE